MIFPGFKGNLALLDFCFILVGFKGNLALLEIYVFFLCFFSPESSTANGREADASRWGSSGGFG